MQPVWLHADSKITSENKELIKREHVVDAFVLALGQNWNYWFADPPLRITFK